MELSQEQSKAVLTESKTALCLAGAGSGKTRVLIGRIQNLLENCHVSPYEVMAVTFTRKAGKEMLERLEKSVGVKAYGVSIGTLHSVALKMIQRFGEIIGLNPGKITVYSSWEEGVLLKDVCKELGYYSTTTYSAIGRHNKGSWKGVKKKEIDAAFYLFYTRKKRNERDYIPSEIMDAFFMRCRENNALTYGMIMTSFLDLIPKIARMLNFKHVLVDETQDLDLVQWRIIKLICSICDASLFVCGDDSQALYEFRGADPGYLIRNQDKFDIYKLKDNYRSDANIVHSANKLIKHNTNRLDLEMNAIRPKENEISVHSGMDSIGIFNNIMNIPNEYQGNIAVLGRNHSLLEKLSRLLSESGIDHEHIGKKTAFTRSEEFRRVHAFLNLAVNPFDNFSFLLVRDYLDIPMDRYRDIRLHAVRENKSHFQVWRESYEFLTERWARYIDSIRDENFHDTLSCLKDFDFEFDPEPVFEFINEYLAITNEPKINEYLDWLALFDVQDEIKEEPKRLQLMTIHASKGLEWSMVIIAGMNNGILPSFRSKSSPPELESERRLTYVAYTRARDHLVLTSRPVDKEAKMKCPPSQFIKESF